MEIPKIDMMMFDIDSVRVIDSFWDDLIDYGDISYKKHRVQ